MEILDYMKDIKGSRLESLSACKTDHQRAQWLIKDIITLALKSPKKAEYVSMLKRIVDEDEKDPAIYKIQLISFSSPRYYLFIRERVKYIIQLIDGDDIKVRDFPEVSAFEIDFLSTEALRKFSKHTPICGYRPNDVYHFYELQRNPATREWKKSRRAIMKRLSQTSRKIKPSKPDDAKLHPCP
jgi:hypothetical protein